MSFQGSINQALGIASEVAGGLKPETPKAEEMNKRFKIKNQYI